MLGDVVGEAGTDYLFRKGLLRTFIKDNRIDLTVANGENSAPGNGISPDSAQILLDSGVDVITGGNHTLQKQSVYSLLDSNNLLLRPANYPPETPGTGYTVVTAQGYKIAVVSLVGAVFMDTRIRNPFFFIDNYLEEIKGQCDIIVTDFHAEATGEKLALARMLDGRVSVFAGTHTHVQTSDIKILPSGTGYITDLGMCGCDEGVIGIETLSAISRFTSVTAPVPISAAGHTEAEGAVFTIDTKTKKCIGAESVIF